MADSVAAITGLDPAQAASYLEMAGGDVEMAVQLFFSMAEGEPAAVAAGGGGGGGSSGGGSSTGGGDGGGGGGDGDEDGETPLLDEAVSPLERFQRHARATNPIFLLAAKSAAAVLRRLAAGDSPDAAMAPYPGPAWEDAVPPPPGADAAAFRETLRKLLTQSWLLLCAVLAPHTPAASSSSSAAAAASCMFASAALYSRIVGSFERRNCSLAVASPVEEYFLAVDAMPDGEARAAAEAVTRPLLESLGSRYRTHCEGVGLYTGQALLNHSCEPNVTLLKPAGDDEHDNRVVASLTVDAAAGEELLNSYVDVSLPLAKRRAELRDYGFECRCAKCEREAAADSSRPPPLPASPAAPPQPQVHRPSLAAAAGGVASLAQAQAQQLSAGGAAPEQRSRRRLK
mmetsp:Transcript_25116/g.82027  ORF Transcript_25116/g.82027 Transcript_25116/m.82027 type:complete len:400 (-) Transcript_25116:120-1319(-)